jgi:hypothetical protein
MITTTTQLLLPQEWYFLKSVCRAHTLHVPSSFHSHWVWVSYSIQALIQVAHLVVPFFDL